MFGDENARVSSPWDALSTHKPKLVPEADEGNVEYKLQLIAPTPARFDRLVTQLKWRLLEGGGQAYYELGVADSGILVGLPPQQLEASLDTLDMMAAEIGASVIVVKEIQVPPELATMAESQLDTWDNRRKTKRDTNDAESEETSRSDSPASPGIHSHSNPSPLLDPALALFAIDTREDDANWADKLNDGDYMTRFAVTLEISTVYKPRPMKKRPIHIASPSHFENPKNSPQNGISGDSLPVETHGAKAQPHRDKRGKRRELTLDALPALVPELASDSAKLVPNHHPISSCSIDEPPLHSLQVAVDPLTSDASATLIASNEFEAVSVPASDATRATVGSKESQVDPQTGDDASGATMVVSNEPRLIVEVLVVWDLSSDELFLDFQGFSLQ